MGASDEVLVPFLDDKPIYGYNKIEHDNSLTANGDYYLQWPILSEKLGDKFTRNSTNVKFGDFNEYVEVIKKTTNMTGDSIIVLKGHWVWGANVNYISLQTYIKNIGLATYLKIDTLKWDTVYNQRLISYHINH